MRAVGGKSGAFDAGLIAGQQIIHFRFKPPPLSKAQIHAQEHLGPVLGLGAAGAGMDGDNGILVVVFATQEQLQFQVTQGLFLGLEFIGRFGQGGLVRLFLGQIQKNFQVFQTIFLVPPGFQGIGDGAALFEDLGGQGGVFPEIGFGG